MKIPYIRVLRVLGIAAIGFVMIGAGLVAMICFASYRSGKKQNFLPPEGQQAVSPVGHMTLVSQTNGGSSFLYLKSAAAKDGVRLTTAVSGIESEASFSHDGKFVVYTYAGSEISKAQVWVVGVDGSNPRPITGKDEDALHPNFSPDDSKIYYAESKFTGNHSPIARPARHDWDVFSVVLQSAAKQSSTAATQITHESLYDLQSLDVCTNDIQPGATKLLISTYGYPIGALIKEFSIGDPGKYKLFQPHVQGESRVGPSYGESRFIHGGMDIIFLAASDGSSAYDYNVYLMSEITGGEINQLTHLKGMTTDLKVLPDGRTTFLNSGVLYVLDIGTQTMKPL